MEIQSIGSSPIAAAVPAAVRAASAQAAPASQPAEPSREEILSTLSDLESLSMAFNRRLQFSVNEDIDQVVVKVIDRETDTVIKEIPPRELQIVHARIREALGALFDVQI
jgi:flagellar protein FlaG